MQKITPFLWFNNNAEEAMNFYISVFKNAKITSLTRYGDAGPGPKGTVMTGIFPDPWAGILCPKWRFPIYLYSGYIFIREL